jgi:ABC-type Fe3+-siderophore transport system permease subunit
MIWRWYVLVQMVHPPFKASKLRFHPIEKIQFFCIPIHYVVHMINLVVLTLFYLHIVVKIEVLFKAIYTYLSHNPKQNLERWKLVEVMETKDFKILWNIRSKWISMIFLSKVALKSSRLL